ncbi:MAG: NTP transferase domain-containing protein [Spirochaetaceae bacterium]|jgi:mannose-1-phosphate guanylyltransferase/mannose-6-phosphate isomerase|nr:NTP transferase domain-containing protein [Spirochaetaceae bacterium]
MFDCSVIMAGGSGTRLWPASNKSRPKQFMPLPNQKEKTFFHAALDRALAVSGPSDSSVIIIAGREHIPHIKDICAAYGGDDLRRMVLIPEPEAKGTAAAVACAAVFAELISGAPRSMLVLTSDHIIEPEADFAEQARSLESRIRHGGLAVFGIAPRYAETAYGYIQANGAETPADGIFTVKSFHEKPDRVTAEKYLEAGNFFWNSGMFAFFSGFILNEFKKYAAGIPAAFEKLPVPAADAYISAGGLRVLEQWRGLDTAYREVRAESFDVAISEKCDKVIMAKAAFNWSDVGSWDEYARLSVPVTENVFSVGSESCFVDSPVPVALCGVDNLIVVVRNGVNGAPPAVLISKKGETQRVKEIVELIKLNGPNTLL